MLEYRPLFKSSIAEVDENICSFLDLSSLNRANRVSKSWFSVTRSNWLWKKICFSHFPQYFNSVERTFDENTVNYRMEYKKAEKEMYCIIVQDNQTISFDKHERAIFRAIKNHDHTTLKLILDTHYRSLDAIAKLFVLTDKSRYTIFNWCGYFNNQTARDEIFRRTCTLCNPNNFTRVILKSSKLNIIQIAAICNQTDFILSVIKKDSRLLLPSANEDEEQSLSAMVCACYNNCYETAHCILENVPTIDLSWPQTQTTCLHAATVCGDSKLLDLLLPKVNDSHTSELAIPKNVMIIDNGKIHVNRPKADNTPMHCALNFSNEKAVRYLLEHNFDINSCSEISNAPIYRALRYGNQKIIRLFLSYKTLQLHGLIDSYLTTSSSLGRTFGKLSGPLKSEFLLLIYRNILPFYQTSAEEIDFTKCDQNGNTLIHWQALCNITDSYPDWPKQSLDQLNKGTVTPLIIAAALGHIEVTKALVKAGANVNNKNLVYYNITAFHAAIENGHEPLVDYYLSLPECDINWANNHNSTPLRTAAEAGHAQIVKKLLMQPNIAVNEGNMHQVTPLSTAAEKGFTIIVADLMLHPNIDITIRMMNECDAIEWANHKQQYKCANLIQLLNRLPSDLQDCWQEVMRLPLATHEQISLFLEKSKRFANLLTKFSSLFINYTSLPSKFKHDFRAELKQSSPDNLIEILREHRNRLLANDELSHELFLPICVALKQLMVIKLYLNQQVVAANEQQTQSEQLQKCILS